jgi:hypothetical protein
VVLLGDLCFGASYPGSRFEARDFDPIFEHVDGLLRQADYRVANLETTLTTQRSSSPKGKKRYVHKDDPRATQALRVHGIDALSLANPRLRLRRRRAQ